MPKISINQAKNNLKDYKKEKEKLKTILSNIKSKSDKNFIRKHLMMAKNGTSGYQRMTEDMIKWITWSGKD